MEELRQAAFAYYKNSSQEFQYNSYKFFQSMDINHDGRVSFGEFCHFLHSNGYNSVDHGWFVQLIAGRDHHRGLDFWDVLTFYYVLKTRGVWCRCCHTQQHGLYFTCVGCFDVEGCPSFDVCSTCYARGNIHHDHAGALFLDSFVLLRSKKGMSPREDFTQAITQPQTDPSRIVNVCFKALEMALTAASLAGNLASCSIM